MERNAERNVQMDLIRSLSMVFVIAAHVSPKPLASHRLFSILFNMVLMTCNSNFYMLSGALNLRKSFACPEDYRKYYIKKAISILFPYVTVSLFLQAWNMAADGQSLTAGSFLTAFYQAFMVENSGGYLWFMYPLAGLLVSAPFLARMLGAMSDSEVKILFAAGMLWNVAGIWLTEDIGVGFAYSGWFLSMWAFHFFLGYYCDRMIRDRERKRLYLLGAVGLAADLAGSFLAPEHNRYSTDLSPAYILFAMSVYLFLKDQVKIRSARAKKCISFAAENSFLVYLLHWNIWQRLIQPVLPVRRPAVYFCEGVVLTLLFSMGFAVLLNRVFFGPIQRLLRRKLADA